jgi:5-methylcytosine-specific restriction enzyme subunit McrC
MTPTRITLSEWETACPVRCSSLAGQSFDGDQASRTFADNLTSRNQLEILEFARGLEIRATSFVGRVKLGEIEITVHPKISGAPLLNLFRYAYGLRDLHLYSGASYSTTHGSFQDLIIQQLGEEVQELMTRGLHRDYFSLSEDLASPRGRIDFNSFFKNYRSGRNSLPCIHFPRSEDTLLNQVLLAGVLLASRLTTDFDLRGRMLRLSKMLMSTASALELDGVKLREAWSAIDRRTRAYEPSLKLIDLLLGSEGVSLSDEPVRLNLRGFLFDMNRFFQSLLSRFLRENLLDCELRDEHRLKGMFAYDPLQNPQNRRDPAPRPDFLIIEGSHIVAVLDAKYRDLWDKDLPPSMLYQLAAYALGHNQTERRAAIIYPASNPHAMEQSITIQDAFKGASQARVDLRPVNLTYLSNLIQAGPGLEAGRRKVQFARQLAFGRIGQA